MRHLNNFSEVLVQQAHAHSHKTLFTFHGKDFAETGRLSFGDLDQRARSIGHLLHDRCRRGDRVLLLFTPGLAFTEAFMGCLYAGVIAVPVFPPVTPEGMRRVENITKDAAPALCLVDDLVQAFLSDEAFTRESPRFAALEKLSTEFPAAQGHRWAPVEAKRDEVAFLQYTSGSTGTPKGVMVTHGNIMANEGHIKNKFHLTEESVIVGWLPQYHDMGLIGNILQPIFSGASNVLFSPMDFVADPFLWLDAISRSRADVSGGPNFAFDLCVTKIEEERLSGLDLSSWQLAFNGAEPLRPETLERFARRFAPYGFHPEAFCPCYGLAENTLMVSSSTRLRGEKRMQVRRERLESGRVESDRDAEGDLDLVGSGTPIAPDAVRVVDPDTGSPLPSGEVGEIWVTGPSRAKGYWNNPGLTREVFNARLNNGEGPFLRTGDLGFFHDTELFVTGRIKDLIIVGGRNIYPQDLEYEAEKSSRDIRPGRSVAFQVEGPDGPQVLLLCEYKGEAESARQAAETIFGLLRTACGVDPERVVLLPPRTIPITTSGKVRRQKARQAYLAGTYAEVARHGRESKEPGNAPKDAPSPLMARIAELVISVSTLTPETLDLFRPLGEQGLTSMEVASLAARLEESFKQPVTPLTLFAHPTVAKLARYLKGDEASAPLSTAAVEPMATEPIAIVGMGCRFPGSEGPEAFFRDLCENTDRLGPFPRERAELFSDTRDGVCERGGFIDGADTFDAAFFGISPAEANRMDPQHRQFLEVAWHALEASGTPPETLAGASLGVFAGISTGDYTELAGNQDQDPSAYGLTGVATTMLANRLSYLLDVTGPSETIDTACSSSLVAIHRAVKALKAGECEMALAGGVNLLFSRSGFAYLNRTGVLSPTGECRPFDASADGYVRGEGIGVVVLKPLSKAKADRDPIYATIIGSASGHGGRTGSLTAPGEATQARVIRAALADAGISPDTLGYVETHGTGTALGDPIEVSGLRQAFGESGESARCAIGSVKRTIGHLEAAAGVAGFIKTAMALSQKCLPPALFTSRPNPLIDFKGGPFFLASEPMPWEPPQGNDNQPTPRRAGVSSFGFGGSYAHVVLEEHAVEQQPGEPDHRLPVVLSAASPDGLTEGIRRLRRHLAQHREALLTGTLSLADISYTLMERRRHASHRLAFTARTASEFLERLDALEENSGEIRWLYRGETKAATPEASPAMETDSAEEVARLWVRGQATCAKRLWPKEVSAVPLPGTPFDAKRFWLDENAPAPHQPDEPIQPLSGEDFSRRVALWLKEEVAFYVGLSADEIDEEAEFHAYGLDSVALIDMLDRLGRHTGSEISTEALQACENIRSLIRFISCEMDVERPDFEGDTTLDEAVVLEAGGRVSEEPEGKIEEIFLTGVTGFFGVWLLSALLEKSRARITCLVRADDEAHGLARIRKTAEGFTAPLKDLTTRVSVVCGDLAEPCLGLAEPAFDRLARQMDTLFHCGATVDWMKPYAALKATNVAGTHEMIRLAFARRKKRLHVVSSLAVLPLEPGRTSYTEGDFPEPHAISNGYGQSKWAAEKLCREAMEMGLPVSIYRFDYVAGALRSGAMKETDFIVRLIKGAIALGAIPEEETNFDILAVDDLAETLVTIALDERNANHTYHLLNRAPFSTSDFGRVIREAGYPVERIPLEAWKQRIEEDRTNPLYPLSPFIRGFSTEEITAYASWRVDNTNTLTALYRSGPDRLAGAPTAFEVLAGVIVFFQKQGVLSPPYRKGVVERQRAFWHQRLDGCPPPVSPFPIAASSPIQRVEAPLGPELDRAVSHLSERTACSREALLLTLFQLYLARVQGENEVAVAVLTETEPTPGALAPKRFITRLAPTFAPTLSEAATLCAQDLREAEAHVTLASEEILALAGWQGEAAAGAPLFCFEGDDPTRKGRMKRNRHLVDASALALCVTSGSRGLHLALSGSADKEHLTAMIRHLRTLVTAGSRDPFAPLTTLPLLSEAEQRQLTARGNDTQVAWDHPETVSRLVASQADRNPEAPAVITATGTLTYGELMARARGITHRLTEAGIGEGDVVGLFLERSPLLVAALLGVMKTGAAYLSLDPLFPPDRIALMLEDASVQAVLTTPEAAPGLPAGPHRMMMAGPASEAGPASADRSNPEAPAYLIYTSGSTGRPKGVVLGHGGLTNLLLAMDRHLAISPAHRFLVHNTLAFDMSVPEYLLPLTKGATLVLMPAAPAKDPFAMVEFIAAQGVTHMQATPSLYRMLLHAGWKPGPDMTLVCGGEAMTREVAAPLMETGATLWNAYGPTETTVWSSMKRMETPEAEGLGAPLANNRFYVLDEDLSPVPEGMAGELCIGGSQVAFGYHGRPELTGDRFRPDPFHSAPGARLYRTGDRVRLSTEGEPVYLGRMDTQVKIRGYRVELGEVEALMEREPWVTQAVAFLAADGGEERLAACLVTEGPEDLAALRTGLAEALPPYMVPQRFVTVKTLPLTPNGKLDRKALAGLASQGPARTGTLPASPDEKALAAIWREILGVATLYREESFVDLGGDSISAIRLITLIRERLGASISVQALFENITLTAMAQAIAGGGAKGDGSRTQTHEAMRRDAALGIAIPDGLPSPPPHAGNAKSILITGATGYLGAYLVATLFRQGEADLLCLVRAKDEEEAFKRLRGNLSTYGLWDEEMKGRITPLPGDLGEKRLGLDEQAFATLAQSVDAVLHNGALVNFSYPYALLKGPNVEGTREIIRLCTTEKMKPLYHVSTVSIFETSGSPAQVTETDALPAPEGLYYGYAQSKWVAEALVREAANQGLPVTVFRPGPIYGDSRSGATNLSDFFNHMIRACSISGEVPMVDVMLDGAPVDYVADTIVAIASGRTAMGEVFHLVNPAPVPLTRVVDYMASYGYPMDRRPFREWVERHAETLAADEQMKQVVPLLTEAGLTDEGKSFFELQTANRPAYGCGNTVAHLEAAGSRCPELSESLFHTYFRYLEEEGFLHN